MPAKKRGVRIAPRKETHPVNVSYVCSMDDLTKIARDCEVIEASSTGLLMHVKRKDLIPHHLKSNLNIDCLIGSRVLVRLEDMNLEISGTVARTQFLGKEGFHLAVDYSADAPDYWRQCLMDLLPIPGELD